MNQIRINDHWEVRVKDTDPDTGQEHSDQPIAISMNRKWAETICYSLNHACDEPNREFYSREIKEMSITNSKN